MGQQVIVERGGVRSVHPDGYGDVGHEAGVETDFPAQAAGGGFATAGDSDGDGEFAIDRQQVGRRIARHGAAESGDLADHTLHFVAVEQPQQAVHFDVVVVPIRGEADKGVSPNQAAEPVGIGAAGRYSVGLVDHQTGYVAMALEQPRQPIQHFVVRESAVAGGYDRLHFLKLFRLDDGIERPFRPDPHLRAIRHPLLLQFEGAPVVDVVADVFLVGQDLMDGGAGPGPVEIG